MNPPEQNASPNTALGARFAATSWSNVIAAQRQGSPEAEAALERLCRTYWYPLYAYLRRKGHDSHRAQDLTQEFLYRLIKENYLEAADRRRGKFRSFLLASLNHFVSNQRDHDNAVKRGGRATVVSLDDTDSEGRFLREPASGMSPEKIFERNWFLSLFEEALSRLREEQSSAGKLELFTQLQSFVIEDAEPGDYTKAAPLVKMTPNAVAVTVHRMRERYKKLVYEEVVRTVADDSEIADELRRFFAVMEG
ncbi:MAG TPA: sigma-70 family RNA polymerase sigma factor [Verrucomicrobiae bacterium]|nr:sigma-70 family RNA polymerase sigma factor [Verrucomicrobiae bacterium]